LQPLSAIELTDVFGEQERPQQERPQQARWRRQRA
jgi:hypothetical protein